MKLKIMNLLDAEGEPIELAMYTHSLINIISAEVEMENKAKNRMTFGDLLADELMRAINEDIEKKERGEKDGMVFPGGDGRGMRGDGDGRRVVDEEPRDGDTAGG